jgi:glycosyltransferase involved in cell wall biosynthesis
LYKSKKIVWVAHESNKSGANLCLIEFVDVLSKLGYNQLVVLPHTGNMEYELSKLGVSSKVIHYYPWVRPVDRGLSIKMLIKRNARNLVAVLSFIKLFHEFKPDIVFTNTSVINVGAIASIFFRAKHLWYIHEMGEEDFNFKLPWGRCSYIFMNSVSHILLTNSEHLREKYIQRYSALKIQVLRYVVKVSKLPTVIEFNRGDKIKLLLLGQVAETKGHLIAIHALANLKALDYPVELSIIGGANDELFFQEIMTLISNLALNDFVHYSGYSDNVPDLISDHHALLMCSKCEAFGRVTIEAMKIGIPVVGSNCCGTSELITHEETGLLFEQGNSMSLCREIVKLFNDDILREKIIKSAKQKIDKLVGEQQIIHFFNHDN